MDEDKKKPVDLEQHRAKNAKNQMEERFYAAFEKIRAHDQQAPHEFLEAWKKGIKLVGVEFFAIKSDTVDAATDKWQLAPNFEFIQKAGGGYSPGKQVLLALMYSFYDPQEGQKLLEQFGTPNFVDALTKLDFEGTEVIATLWSNYSGW